MSKCSVFFQINLNFGIYKCKIFPVASYRWDAQFLIQLKCNGLYFENNEANICPKRNKKKLKDAEKYGIRHFITCIFYLNSFSQLRIRAFHTLHDPDNDANIKVNLEDLDEGGRMLLK